MLISVCEAGGVPFRIFLFFVFEHVSHCFLTFYLFSFSLTFLSLFSSFLQQMLQNTSRTALRDRGWSKKTQLDELFVQVLRSPKKDNSRAEWCRKRKNINWHDLNTEYIGRSDGRTVGRTDGRTDGRSDGRAVGRTDGRSDRPPEKRGR